MDGTQDNQLETTEETQEAQPHQNQATVLLSLEELIKSHIASLDKLSAELREARQMFADGFENDSTYKEQEEKVKEANKIKLATKKEIIKRPSVLQIAEKIKNISSEVREKKNALSDYLLEYQRLSGATQIEADNGEVHEIINEAKLIKRSAKK